MERTRIAKVGCRVQLSGVGLTMRGRRSKRSNSYDEDSRSRELYTSLLTI